MGSLFSKIVSGDIPCHKVAENDKFLAFLDLNPLREGHTLVIPKVEIDYIFDVEDTLLGEMMIFSKCVAKKIKDTFPCNRIGVTVIGLEVPHAHIHLIPIDTLDDMNFSKEKMSPSQEELAHTASILLKA
ncbi:MAG: histidine triad (HIT) family protein [Crocinitomicaceae bacterium]|jgi:histidine triad (HIT) family protein